MSDKERYRLSSFVCSDRTSYSDDALRLSRQPFSAFMPVYLYSVEHLCQYDSAKSFHVAIYVTVIYINPPMMALLTKDVEVINLHNVVCIPTWHHQIGYIETNQMKVSPFLSDTDICSC